MNKKSIIIIFAIAVVIVAAILFKHHFGNNENHVVQHSKIDDTQSIEWTPSIHSALTNEMKAITVNYQNLVIGIAAGDWENIVKQSHAIYSSFILKQELSEEDMHDLHQILPERFIEMDSQFHDQAKKLALAAKQHDSELAIFYSGKLLEGCVSCHDIYASERFPNLEPAAIAKNHQINIE